jgi:hypothetical protein
MMPTLGSGVLAVALAPGAVASPPPAAGNLPGSATPICLTVAQNSPPSVIDLRAAYAAVSGLQQRDGLKLSILGNSNSGLVSTALSDAALTLTYARGKCGTATITLCATDADGVSVKRALVITVRPPSPAAVVSVSTLPTGQLVALPSGTLP